MGEVTKDELWCAVEKLYGPAKFVGISEVATGHPAGTDTHLFEANGVDGPFVVWAWIRREPLRCVVVERPHKPRIPR